MKKVLLSLCLFFTYYVFAAEITPQIIKEQAAQREVQELVNDLWDNAQNWDLLTEEISLGNTEWINIVPILISGSDANVAESLGIALTAGLSTNPMAVFSVLDDKNDAISVDRICTMYYIEPNHDSLYHYYDNTRQKLVEAGDSVKKCLKVLNDAMDYIKLQEAKG